MKKNRVIVGVILLAIGWPMFGYTLQFMETCGLIFTTGIPSDIANLAEQCSSIGTLQIRGFGIGMVGLGLTIFGAVGGRKY